MGELAVGQCPSALGETPEIVGRREFVVAMHVRMAQECVPHDRDENRDGRGDRRIALSDPPGDALHGRPGPAPNTQTGPHSH
jgi:hypothetical protein